MQRHCRDQTDRPFQSFYLFPQPAPQGRSKMPVSVILETVQHLPPFSLVPGESAESYRSVARRAGTAESRPRRVKGFTTRAKRACQENVVPAGRAKGFFRIGRKDSATQQTTRREKESKARFNPAPAATRRAGDRSIRRHHHSETTGGIKRVRAPFLSRQGGGQED